MSSSLHKEAIKYSEYKSELQLPEIIHLIENDLSEPYSVYTYRYFIHNWPNLCFLAKDGDKYVGVIICKLDRHKDRLRGYIAMLAVAKTHRKMSIGSNLVKMAIHAMKDMNADEVVLETEFTNQGALGLYQRLGFIKDKRLYRYYLNGVDAFRLKLFCKTMIKQDAQVV
ncbi:N-alpha-acetyltransferase 30 isoform X1 [Mucor ambiguus]|uniref:N-terminal methionine N(alpha)-acetyltransferase NatC n=1 Tax=Mucor ambiguus TaxID=91626 RepID=A0A0C9MF71_9FUNG|nr:N-alpha-acetyltransferase 30 isoform X1 [Mucor ambiguus]